MADFMSFGHGRLLTHPAPVALWATVTFPDASEQVWPSADEWGLARCDLDQFFTDVFATSWYSTLAQMYSQPDKLIGAGTFLGTSGIGLASSTPSPTIDDYDIQESLKSEIAHGLLPDPSGDVIYVILVPPAVTVTRQGRQSGQFGGYHDSFPLPGGRDVFYCVIADALDGNVVIERVSHEFAEAITDPIAGQGWTGPPAPGQTARREICDFCEDLDEPNVGIAGYALAKFAAKSDGKCGPDREPGTRAVVDTARIWFERSLTRSSCVGAIIEDQSVFFHVTTLHRGKPSIAQTFHWSADDSQNLLVFPEGVVGYKPVFAVIVPFGVTSFHVEVVVTTSLGCIVTADQHFSVVTQAVADRQDVVCEEINRLQQLAHVFLLPLRFPADLGPGARRHPGPAHPRRARPPSQVR